MIYNADKTGATATATEIAVLLERSLFALSINDYWIARLLSSNYDDSIQDKFSVFSNARRKVIKSHGGFLAAVEEIRLREKGKYVKSFILSGRRKLTPDRGRDRDRDRDRLPALPLR